MKVLDLSRILAGPYATMLLADMGADVIKVEHPSGDETRRWGPPFLEGTAVYYLAMNRNKRSLRLDLKDPDNRLVAQQLAAEADVVVENFRPGTLSAFGLDHDTIRETNPAVVYASITAFGSDSPMRDVGGYDLVVQAMGGIMSVTGEPGRPPVKVGVANADLSAGMYATMAILGALYERSEGGKGRNVEVALMDAQVASLANQSMNWLAGGFDPQPLGSDHPNVTPYGGFATMTGYLVVAVGSDKQFRRLCTLVGRDDIADDPRYEKNSTRVAHRDELRAELEPIFLQHTREHWLEVMEKAGIPGGPVRSVREVFEDPMVAERMVRMISEETLGEVPQVISPFRFDGRSVQVDLPPPSLGAHDEEIFNALRLSAGAPRMAPSQNSTGQVPDGQANQECEEDGDAAAS